MTIALYQKTSPAILTKTAELYLKMGMNVKKSTWSSDWMLMEYFGITAVTKEFVLKMETLGMA